jgi:hypothetical protein
LPEIPVGATSDRTRQIGEYAEHGGDRQEAVIETLSQFAYLDDDIDVMAFQALHDSPVGVAILARVHIVGTPAACPVSLDDLPAMLEVERGADDLQSLLACGAPQPVEFAD